MWRNLCPRRNHNHDSTTATAATTDYNSTTATATTADYNSTASTDKTTDHNQGTTATMTTTTNHDYESTAAAGNTTDHEQANTGTTLTTTLLPGDWPMQALESQPAPENATAGCQLLMLGSGSCLHACPRDFAPTPPGWLLTVAVGATAMNGQSIPVHGKHEAHLA